MIHSQDLPTLHHAVDLRVRWADTDAGGIAYHGAYLAWLESTRVEHFRRMAAHATMVTIDHRSVQDELLKNWPLSFAVVACSINWSAPARVDARLRGMTRITRVGRSSIEHAYEIVRYADDQVCASASTTIVHVGDDGRAREVPTQLREAIARYQDWLLAGG